jgi:D-alanyl-D-alanine carboxypeptidase
VQAVLDAARRGYGAPGALAVLERGGVRTFAASGSAGVDGTPITAATRFRIASITKPIVAALVLDAVDRGEVALEDVVGDLLPGVLRAEPPVTVRQLLAHTSGVYDESNGVATQDQLEGDIAALTDPDLRAEARADLARALAGRPVFASDRLIVALSETHDRYFAPGVGYHYSNTNYQLAAMVLEKATAARGAAAPTDRRAAGPRAHDDRATRHGVARAPRLWHEHHRRFARGPHRRPDLVRQRRQRRGDLDGRRAAHDHAGHRG